MSADSDIQIGSILPNDHGEGWEEEGGVGAAGISVIDMSGRELLSLARFDSFAAPDSVPLLPSTKPPKPTEP
jgi:hypothetical protein